MMPQARRVVGNRNAKDIFEQSIHYMAPEASDGFR
jgi:hypothetical protein